MSIEEKISVSIGLFFFCSSKLEHYRTLENAFQHLTKTEQTLTEEKSKFKIRTLELEHQVCFIHLDIIVIKYVLFIWIYLSSSMFSSFGYDN